jgi:hypothetical protein
VNLYYSNQNCGVGSQRSKGVGSNPGVTPRHDFIDFLLTEHFLTYFLLVGKIIDSKKCGSNINKNSHQKWMFKMFIHQNWLIHQKNSIWVSI